jgi:hypothetical protein
MLHTTFYQTMIIVHRPFIPQSDNTDDPQIDRNTSFAICKNAARTLARIIHTFAVRFVFYPATPVLLDRGSPNLVFACSLPRDGGESWMFFSGFHAALILMLDYWGGGGTTREDVEKVVESLAVREEQYVDLRSTYLTS